MSQNKSMNCNSETSETRIMLYNPSPFIFPVTLSPSNEANRNDSHVPLCVEECMPPSFETCLSSDFKENDEMETSFECEIDEKTEPVEVANNVQITETRKTKKEYNQIYIRDQSIRDSLNLPRRKRQNEESIDTAFNSYKDSKCLEDSKLSECSDKSIEITAYEKTICKDYSMLRECFYKSMEIDFKPAFGTPAPNPFGQTQVFGAAPTTFGSPSTFGQTSSTPMFGTPQQNNLFGTTPANTFGTNQTGFGATSNIFGQPPQPTTNLFGSPSPSTFGQQNKSTGFSFNSQPFGIFGQTTQAQPSNMFQPPSSSNIFGAPSFGLQTAQSGTVIKFAPVSGTASMQKSGSTTAINTKNHSITCMKEYENKSFEELRFEDYAANRKGPQQTSAFGAPAQPFGSAVLSTPSMFGQPDKPAFGAANGFGQSSIGFGMTSQANTSQGFGKPSPAFGATSSTTGFGLNNVAANTNVFGSNTAQQPFGAQPAQPSFSAPTQNSIFGQPTSTAQTAGPFFQPPQATFPTQQTEGYMGFGQTPASTPTTTLFQTTKPNTWFNIFGQNTTTTGAFGQTSTPAFGSFGNTFNKPAQPNFGQTTQAAPTFGSTLNMQGGGLFGTMNKPTFGTTGTGLFSNTSLQPTNNTFSMQVPTTETMR